jgi:pimeloyl-ACP methyl ester carboxylesterase
MPRSRSTLAVWLIFGVVFFGSLVPGGAQAAPAPTTIPVESFAPVQSVYLRPPQEALAEQPLQVLLALHGMGGSGEEFARNLLEYVDRGRWLLVAPTFEYGDDWQDPDEVALEDPALIEWLAEFIDDLPDWAGVPVRPKVLLLGHSRGAQLAHRFAFFHPDRVLAVAALSAGTYTLPLSEGPEGEPITFPFGVGDLPELAGRPFNRAQLEKVQFWVTVGSEDNNPDDLPDAWDAYIGATRVHRARAFQRTMRSLGARSHLLVYGGAHHDLTPAMWSGASAFLRGVAMAEMDPPYYLPSTRKPVPI